MPVLVAYFYRDHGLCDPLPGQDIKTVGRRHTLLFAISSTTDGLIICAGLSSGVLIRLHPHRRRSAYRPPHRSVPFPRPTALAHVDLHLPARRRLFLPPWAKHLPSSRRRRSSERVDVAWCDWDRRIANQRGGTQPGSSSGREGGAHLERADGTSRAESQCGRRGPGRRDGQSALRARHHFILLIALLHLRSRRPCTPARPPLRDRRNSRGALGRVQRFWRAGDTGRQWSGGRAVEEIRPGGVVRAGCGAGPGGSGSGVVGE